jgi:hypothetical protein
MLVTAFSYAVHRACSGWLPSHLRFLNNIHIYHLRGMRLVTAASHEAHGACGWWLFFRLQFYNCLICRLSSLWLVTAFSPAVGHGNCLIMRSWWRLQLTLPPHPRLMGLSVGGCLPFVYIIAQLYVGVLNAVHILYRSFHVMRLRCN